MGISVVIGTKYAIGIGPKSTAHWQIGKYTLYEQMRQRLLHHLPDAEIIHTGLDLKTERRHVTVGQLAGAIKRTSNRSVIVFPHLTYFSPELKIPSGPSLILTNRRSRRADLRVSLNTNDYVAKIGSGNDRRSMYCGIGVLTGKELTIAKRLTSESDGIQFFNEIIQAGGIFLPHSIDLLYSIPIIDRRLFGTAACLYQERPRKCQGCRKPLGHYVYICRNCRWNHHPRIAEGVSPDAYKKECPQCKKRYINCKRKCECGHEFICKSAA